MSLEKYNWGTPTRDQQFDLFREAADQLGAVYKEQRDNSAMGLHKYQVPLVRMNSLIKLVGEDQTPALAWSFTHLPHDLFVTTIPPVEDKSGKSNQVLPREYMCYSTSDFIFFKVVVDEPNVVTDGIWKAYQEANMRHSSLVNPRWDYPGITFPISNPLKNTTGYHIEESKKSEFLAILGRNQWPPQIRIPVTEAVMKLPERPFMGVLPGETSPSSDIGPSPIFSALPG